MRKNETRDRRRNITTIRVPACIPLEEKIGLAVRRAHGRIAEIVGKHLAQDGISPREYACLCICADLCRRCDQREVADLLCVNENNVVSTISRLQHLQLIRRARDPDDRRHWYLSITPEGTALLPQATQHVLQAHRELQHGMTDDEWKHALRILWTLAGVELEDTSAEMPRVA